jgi:hypothetical protein
MVVGKVIPAGRGDGLELMVAESHTEEMDTMVKVVVSLINRKN